MTAPQVYRAINAISRELVPTGIAKLHRNERDDYVYRSIDDVLNRLAPLFAKHKLCVLPRVLERTSTDRIGQGDQLLVCVALKIAFDLVSTADGSSHIIQTYGEALDQSDKATTKAMSSAYKSAMLQAFCVPVAQIDDADASSRRLKHQTHASAPVEGWEQWSAGIIDIASSCATREALERLQDRQRPLLNALSRERPDLYTDTGVAFARQIEALNREQFTPRGARDNSKAIAKPRRRAPRAGRPTRAQRATGADATGPATRQNRDIHLQSEQPADETGKGGPAPKATRERSLEDSVAVSETT